MRSATSRWNISTSRSNHGGHGSVGASRSAAASRCCRAGWRRCARGPPTRGLADRGQRVAAIDFEPARIARGDFAERGDGAVVALDRDNPARALREQRTRQAARPGADLDHGDAVERPGGAGDPPGQIEVEEEILTE